MSVYFFQRGDLIKIGQSTNPGRRLRELPPGRLLAIEPGGREREQELHARFSTLRVYGEWFTADPALLGYIATVPAVDLPIQPKGARNTTWNVYDRVLPGGLPSLLKELAAEHDGSVEDVTFALHERGIHVATATVRRWLEHLVTA